MKIVLALLTITLFSATAYAGFQGLNGSTSLGVLNKLKCSTGLTCTKVGDTMSVVSSPTITAGALDVQGDEATDAYITLSADQADDSGDVWKIMSKASDDKLYLQNNTSGSQVTKWSMDTSGNVTNAGTLTVTGATTLTGGVVAGSGQYTNYGRPLESLTGGTDTTPSITTVYLSQVRVGANATITGVKVNNGSACGSDKWIVALFDSTGASVANSTTAGTTCSGTAAYQTIAFTGTYAAKGPGVFWIALYANGTTARFRSLPAASEGTGLAGSVTAQTFGTVASVTLPTTFTADKGPVAFLY